MVPLGAALLFLVHPLGTETVTYLSGRATGLAAFWYLAGLLLYLRASRPGHSPRMLSWAHVGAIGCFMLALLSKETAITFPLALLLVEIVARRTRGSALRTIVVRLHTPFWAVLLVFLGAAAMTPRYRVLLDAALNTRPFYEHLISQLNVVGYATTLVVAPGRMNFDHDFPQYASMLAWPTPIALALLLGLIALAVGRARAQPLLAFGIGWFFLQLLATNSVLQREDLLSERNLYLPAAGLFLALASTWYALERTYRRLGFGAARPRPSGSWGFAHRRGGAVPVDNGCPERDLQRSRRVLDRCGQQISRQNRGRTSTWATPISWLAICRARPISSASRWRSILTIRRHKKAYARLGSSGSDTPGVAAAR